MKSRLAPAVLVLAAIPLAEGGLELEDNPENVVASRLAGTWVLDGGLTEHLRGRPTDDGARRMEVEFDGAVVESVPADFADFLSEDPVFAAGRYELDGKAGPFLLTTLNGNPHMIAFCGPSSDPYSDLRSYNVELVPALVAEDDLLFVGTDRNDGPFDAFRRASDSDAR